MLYFKAFKEGLADIPATSPDVQSSAQRAREEGLAVFGRTHASIRWPRPAFIRTICSGCCGARGGTEFGTADSDPGRISNGGVANALIAG